MKKMKIFRPFHKTVLGPDDLVVRTPDPNSGPWELRCGFEVSPFAQPMVAYFLQYNHGQPPVAPIYRSEWFLMNATKFTPKWDLADVSESIFDTGYRNRSAPMPSYEQVRNFLIRSRRMLVEAHIATVAQKFSSELTSEDVRRIWGLEDARIVMES